MRAATKGARPQVLSRDPENEACPSAETQNMLSYRHFTRYMCLWRVNGGVSVCGRLSPEPFPPTFLEERELKSLIYTFIFLSVSCLLFFVP